MIKLPDFKKHSLFTKGLFALTIIFFAGATSKVYAVANKVTAIAVAAQVGTVTAGTAGSVTFQITLTCSGGASTVSSSTQTLTWSALTPTGVTQTYTATNPVTLPAGASTVIQTLTLNTTAATGGGSYPFTITSSSNSKTSPTAMFTVLCSTFTYAALPYTQNFDGTWQAVNCSGDAVGSPDAFWNNTIGGTSPSGYDYWHKNNYAGADWSNGNNIGTYSPTNQSGGFSALFNSFEGPSGSTGAFDLYVNLSGGCANLSFYYLGDQTGTGSLTVQLSTNGGSTFTNILGPLLKQATPAWTLESVAITGGTATSVIRFLGTSDFKNGSLGIDNLSVTAAPAVTVTNFSTPSASSFCAGSPSVITVNSTTLATGTYTVTYSTTGPNAVTNATATMNFTAGSPGSGTFTTVALANAVSTPLTINSLSNGCNTGTPTSGNTITINTYSPTYATLPYTMDFESTWGTNGCTGDLIGTPDASWRNDGTATNAFNYWHRSDYSGTDWTTALPNGTVYPIPSESGSYSAVYDNKDAVAASTGALDLYVNLSSSPCNPTLSFWYYNATAAGATTLTVELSTNGGSTFSTTLLTLGSAVNTWTNETVTIPSTGSTCVIRFLATGNHGAKDIGIDNLTITPVSTPVVTNFSIPSATPFCAGTSSMVTVNSSTLVAGTYTVTYNLGAPNTATGLTATMAFAAGTGTFTTGALATAGNTLITVTGVQNSCSSAAPSGGNTYTLQTAPVYATPPYSQDFESNWITTTCTGDANGIPDVNWNGVEDVNADPYTLWHRSDYTGADWGNSGPCTYPTPAESGSYSAIFNSCNAQNGEQGALDLYVDLSGGCYTLSFWYASDVTGSGNMIVQLSTDGGSRFNQIFPSSGSLGAQSTWVLENIPLTSGTATSVIRFLGTADFGFGSLGIDNLAITPAGSVNVTNFSTNSATTFCAQQSSTVTVSSSTLATGAYIVTYNLGAPNAVTGATTTLNFTAGSPGTGTFTTGNLAYTGNTLLTITSVGNGCVSNSPSGGNTITLTSVTPTYATVPYFQDFESNWLTSACDGDALGAPDGNWTNYTIGTSPNGNDYWHRNDYTSNPDWSTCCGTTPAAESGSFAACFNSYGAPAGSTGALDLYINLSSCGYLSFWYYSEVTGTGTLTVLLSTDGGATFPTTLMTAMGSNAGYTLEQAAITGGSATSVIRFLGTADFGSGNLCIDNLSVTTSSVWSGATSTDWNVGSNWCTGVVPNASSIVIIPSGTPHNPTTNTGASAVCASLTVNSGAILTVPKPMTVSGSISNAGTMSNSANISLTGNWTNAGTFTSTNTVQFSGTTAQTITGATTFSTLDINNTVGVTLASAITTTVLTIGDVTANSIFSDGGNQVTSGGTLNLISGKFDIGGETATITTYPGFGTNTISTGTTVIYSSTTGPQIIASAPTYSNLTFTGSTKNSGGVITANNLFTQTGGQFALSNHNITVGSLTGTGNIGNATTGVAVFTIGSDNTSPAVYSGNILAGTPGTKDISLVKTGSGTLTLSGTSTFSKGSTINGGIVDMKSNAALGTSANGTSTVASGAAIQLDGSGLTIAVPITINGAGVTASPAGAINNLANNNTWSGTVTLGSNATINSTGGTLTFSSATAISGAFALTFTGAGNTAVNSVIATGAGSVVINGTSPGIVTLSKTNTYSGGTSLTAGQLALGGAAITKQIGTGPLTISGGSLDNTTGGAFTYGNTITQTWNGSFAFVGTASLNMGTGTVTLAASSNPTVTVTANTLTEGGTVTNASGLNSLTKAGIGTLAFGANPVTLSALNINAGTLSAPTPAATGIISLGGSGVVFNNAGTFTANSGNVTFTGGSAQQITGATTFFNVTISNSGGVSLNNIEIISATGTLLLSNGILSTTPTSYMSVLNTSNTAVSGSASSYVDGPLQWALGASTNYTFPLGNGGTYYPFGASTTSTVASPVINVYAKKANVGATSFNAPIVGGLSTTEYWFASLTGTYTGTITLTRSAIPIDVGSAIGQSSTTSGPYSVVGGTVGTVSNPTITSITGAALNSTSLGYLVIGNTAANGRFGLFFDYY